MATQFDPIAKDESLNTTEVTPRNIADVIAEGLKGIEDALPTYTEGDGIDISAQKVISVDTTFTEASTRANIASGDSFSTILGKIKKFFTDLKAVAFSGAAADVTYDNTQSGLTATDVQDAIDAVNDALAYKSLTVTPGANYAGYTCIVRVYKDRIVLYFNGQNSQTIVPTGASIFGTISNWTYGVRQVQGVIRDASGANYIFTLFGIDASGTIYISAPASFPSGLYANCMTISDTIPL